MVLFYHNNYYIGFSQQKGLLIFSKSFFMVWLRQAQPPRWKIIYFMFLFIIFWNAKIFYYSYVFKEAKLAKFIRYEALWKLYIFYHKVLGDVVKWWRFWGLWGTLEIVKMWSWNIFLFEEILHHAALRSEWQDYVFCSRLGIWIIFETQRFFIILIFLRKQSGNSLANCWSVCLNLYISQGSQISEIV